MTDFTFNTTPSIRQANGAAGKLGEVIKGHALVPEKSNVMFVTDPGIVALGLADAAIENLT